MRFQFQAGAPAPFPRKPTGRAPSVPAGHPAHRRPTGGAVAVLLACAAMAGCAHRQPPAWKVEPVLSVKHSAEASEAYYALGRYHDGSRAYDKAVDAYRKALAANPRNAEAFNALGVALAHLHRHAEAEVALRKAIAIAPGSAHIRSNLGHLLMLTGQPRKAIDELTAALNLDPANQVAQANLQDALGASKRSQSGVVAATAATSAAKEAAAAPAEDAADIQAAAQVAPAPVPAATASDTPTSLQAVRLELSNGNGIPGAAARLKRWLIHEGLAVQRLSNRQPYVQQQTVIQYRTGQQATAQRVAEALRMTAQLDAMPSAGLQPDVRVVLGHDWTRTVACLERRACGQSATTVAVMVR